MKSTPKMKSFPKILEFISSPKTTLTLTIHPSLILFKQLNVQELALKPFKSSKALISTTKAYLMKLPMF